MNQADRDAMQAAADATVLPSLAMPQVQWLQVAGDETAMEVIQPTTDLASIAKKVALLKINNTIGPGLKLVNVAICGPVMEDVQNLTQQSLHGSGSSNQVDFDDPAVTLDDKDWTPGSAADLKKFLATKLRVQ